MGTTEEIIELIRRELITDNVKVSAKNYTHDVEWSLTPDEVSELVTQIMSGKDSENMNLYEKIMTIAKEAYLMGIGVGYGSALLETNEKADKVMRTAPTWNYEPEKTECCVCGKKINAWGSKSGYPLGESCCDDCFSEVIRERQKLCDIHNDFVERGKRWRSQSN